MNDAYSELELLCGRSLSMTWLGRKRVRVLGKIIIEMRCMMVPLVAYGPYMGSPARLINRERFTELESGKFPRFRVRSSQWTDVAVIIGALGLLAMHQEG